MSAVTDFVTMDVPPLDKAEGQLELEFPVDPGSVPMIRKAATTVSAESGCPEDRISDVKLATTELASNAVRADVAANWRGLLRVTWYFFPRGVAVIFEDHWPGMKAPSSVLPGEEDRIGGHGLTIVLRTSDGLFVSPVEADDHKIVGCFFEYPATPVDADAVEI